MMYLYTGHAADMEKQLEAFLEHAANAASQATGDEGQEGQDDESHTDSEHSGTGSDAESDVSDRSPGAKDANDVKDAGGSAAGKRMFTVPVVILVLHQLADLFACLVLKQTLTLL